jgi:hypothetical protein
MDEIKLKAYIESQLAELQSQQEIKNMSYKGKISFGMQAKKFSHLPAWNELVKKKNSLSKLIWINAFFISVFLIAIAGDFWQKFEMNWLKALTSLLLLSAMVTVLYVFSFLFSLFVKFRETDLEVRKLIYQDLIFQIENKEH